MCIAVNVIMLDIEQLKLKHPSLTNDELVELIDLLLTQNKQSVKHKQQNQSESVNCKQRFACICQVAIKSTDLSITQDV
jgi:hypothetical protein